MRLRTVFVVLSLAVFSPLVAIAQQASTPLVAFAAGGSGPALRAAVQAFEDGLKQAGYVSGQNVTVEYRFAEGKFDRFPGFISEFIKHRASVIVTSSNAGAFAAKKATSTIPLVFSIGDDPVKLGLVSSLNRPGGNMTGAYQFATGLEGKRLGLLHEMVPKASTISALIHPNFDLSGSQSRDVQEAAAALGLKLVVVHANAESEFDAAFSAAAQQKAGAILICASPFFNSRRQQLIVLAARHGLPAIYEWREFAEAGGLMSYGTKLPDAYRQAGVYAGRILRGDKPSDLPVVQVANFEFVINMSTAKALGLEVPGALSARADEIIE
jgi:putative tryptophan/tyrosine transport system substrate-binding protein